VASRKTASVEASPGEQVREMREAQALTLDNVADAVGISSPYLSRIETGRQLPARKTFRAIADQLSEKPAELVAERDKAELESMGYSPEVAEVAVALGRLDAQKRRRLAEEMAGMLAATRTSREPGLGAVPAAVRKGEPQRTRAV